MALQPLAAVLLCTHDGHDIQQSRRNLHSIFPALKQWVPHEVTKHIPHPVRVPACGGWVQSVA